MPIPDSAICDTSVVLRFVRDHNDNEQRCAETLIDAWFRERTRVSLLDLGIYEFINIVVRRWGWNRTRARRGVGRLFDLDFEIATCDRDLAMQTAGIAAETGLSGYDAAFVAAARALAMPLITCDDRIVDAAPDVAVPLRSIGED